MKTKLVKSFLEELLNDLCNAQKALNSDEKDDTGQEEFQKEYLNFINSNIPKIQDILEIPLSGIKIVSALYGHGSAVKDVKDEIESQINPLGINMRIDNYSMDGDPAPNIVKTLTVVYSLGEETKTVKVKEGEDLKILSYIEIDEDQNKNKVVLKKKKKT